MKLSNKLLITVAFMLSSILSFAQINNSKTETFFINGECGMCKSRIEKAGSTKKEAQVNWDANTKKATITFDSEKTNADEILKRIAVAGHDNERFLTSNDTYSKLHGCCQYERADNNVSLSSKNETVQLPNVVEKNANPSGEHQLEVLLNNYFAVKDALIKADTKETVASATQLLSDIKKLDANQLNSAEVAAWNKAKESLTADVTKIATSKNIANQRKSFSALSKTVYELLKVGKPNYTIYHQYCPMYDGGANWLSKESAIKNPYFGAQMLTCGNTIETIN